MSGWPPLQVSCVPEESDFSYWYSLDYFVKATPRYMRGSGSRPIFPNWDNRYMRFNIRIEEHVGYGYGGLGRLNLPDLLTCGNLVSVVCGFPSKLSDQDLNDKYIDKNIVVGLILNKFSPNIKEFNSYSATFFPIEYANRVDEFFKKNPYKPREYGDPNWRENDKRHAPCVGFYE